MWRVMKSPVSGVYEYIGSGAVVGGLDLEGHLGPAREQLLEQVGRLDGEPPQRFLEPLAGALKRGHATEFLPVTRVSFPARRTLQRAPGAQTATACWRSRGHPAAPVAAHVLDQRHEGLALVGERVLDPRRDLGIGAALDDPLLLERPQAQRERAWADPVERALELTEAVARRRRGP